MIIEHIRVSNFRSIRDLTMTFYRDSNTIVGPNGSGKSSLLHIIAGLTGSDEASELIEGEAVGYCQLGVTHNGASLTFETTGKFLAEDIGKFKQRLKTRTNFPLTDIGLSFPSKCVLPATAKERFRRYALIHSDMPDIVYNPANRSLGIWWGDGFRHAYSLLSLDSLSDEPLLLDLPERHLDIRGQAMMNNFLLSLDRQLIMVTHSPQMLGDMDRALSMEGQV